MVTIHGGSSAYQRRINEALNAYPDWMLRASRLAGVEVTKRQDIREQIAQYQHESRMLLVYDGIGELMYRAIGHELSHACDDNFESPHFFSSTDAWRRIHRDQNYFDIPKYEQEPLEYFADMFQKFIALGTVKLAITHPAETQFFAGYVVPVLVSSFGG